MDLELNRLSAVETPVRAEVRLADPDGSLAKDGIRFPAPFHVEGAARAQRGLFLVTGHVTGVLELECGRCLAPVRTPIDLRFEARFAEASAAPRPSAIPPASSSSSSLSITDGKWSDEEDGIRLELEDLDVSYLPAGTSVLRLEDVVREQVLLEVPFRPLCRPDCRGLCPRCGADLNAGQNAGTTTDGLPACGCPPEETHDLRLAGLAELKKRMEGGNAPGNANKSKKKN